MSKFSLWRIGQNDNKCIQCNKCEQGCQGGCEPGHQIYSSECILCFNCRDDCAHNTISYQTKKSTSGEITDSGHSRRTFLLTMGSGMLAVPALRLGGLIGTNWHHGIVRPPGAVAEQDFLKRCIKCGQCMRICPTNVIQPGSISGGIENRGGTLSVTDSTIADNHTLRSGANAGGEARGRDGR